MLHVSNKWQFNFWPIFCGGLFFVIFNQLRLQTKLQQTINPLQKERIIIHEISWIRVGSIVAGHYYFIEAESEWRIYLPVNLPSLIQITKAVLCCFLRQDSQKAFVSQQWVLMRISIFPSDRIHQEHRKLRMCFKREMIYILNILTFPQNFLLIYNKG